VIATGSSISSTQSRAEDLRSLAIIYDKTPGELTDQLIDWGVLPPEARPVG